MLIGLDASNLRSGGGVTHLRHLLAASDPDRDRFERVVVWGGRRTLEQIPAHPWIERRHEPALDGSLWRRVAWQQQRFPRQAAELGCDILFEPGGTVPLAS